MSEYKQWVASFKGKDGTRITVQSSFMRDQDPRSELDWRNFMTVLNDRLKEHGADYSTIRLREVRRP